MSNSAFNGLQLIGPIISPLSVSAPVTSIPAMAIPPVAVRLNSSNFMLWRGLTLPNLCGAHLHGFLDNSVPAPAKTIIEGIGAAAKDVPNPEYARWWALDQKVIGALLSSMDEDISM